MLIFSHDGFVDSDYSRKYQISLFNVRTIQSVYSLFALIAYYSSIEIMQITEYLTQFILL